MQHGIRAGATALAVMLAAVLTGCSGGSGASVEELPGSGGGTSGATYNGPPPSTPDVQAFKIYLYDNVRAGSPAPPRAGRTAASRRSSREPTT